MMNLIKNLTNIPRRVQPIRHILSRERRHREMKQREKKFAEMLLREKRKKGGKNKCT